ncbi:hypothetical protein ThvES_00002740, partial [Thiovulum sp. ES]
MSRMFQITYIFKLIINSLNNTSFSQAKCKDYFEKMNFVFIEFPKFNKKIESQQEIES